MTTDDFVVETGGCAANAAIALARLGVRAAVVAKVGDDHFGAFVEDELSAAGVDVAGIRRAAGLGTSKTVIVPVSGEDRRFIHTFGANATLCAADLAPALATRARRALHRRLPRPARAAPGRARGAASVVRGGPARASCFDVVAPAGRTLSLDDVAGVLPEVDYFVPNDDEAAALTGRERPAPPGRAPARARRRHGDRHAGRARADRGRPATRRSSCLPPTSTSSSRPAPATPSPPGSSTGCSKAGRCAAALEFASVIGASACTHLGCTAGLFTRAEADALLESHAPCPSPR